METFALFVWLTSNTPSASLNLNWPGLSEHHCEMWRSDLRKERPDIVSYCIPDREYPADGIERAVNGMVKRAASKAGINEAVSPHWLRHAHGSHAIDRGAPLPEVQSTWATATSQPRRATCTRGATHRGAPRSGTVSSMKSWARESR